MLKLGDNADLQPGEHLVGSDKVSGDSGSIRMALVDDGGHKSLRLGIGGADFGTSDDEAGPWRAGPNRVTGINAAGYTANIDQAAAERLHTTLADALGAAGKAQKDPSQQSGGTWGDVFSAEGSVPGQWADVHYAVYVDDPAAGVQVTLGAVPHASGRDLSNLDGHLQAATFDPAGAKRFLALLTRYVDAGPEPKSADRFHTSPRLPQKEGRVDAKSFSRVEIKSEDRGQVTAVFATFGVVDSDGDVTMPGAFQEGAEAPISQYGHTSWQGALPVGKGRIRTTGKEAIVEGQFFMDTTHGRDAFLTVKQLGTLGQWSYGYDVLDSEQGDFKGRQVRYLKQQLVHEFSPTLIGAGINTRTLSTKGRSPDVSGGSPMGFAFKAAIKPHDTQITTGAWDASAAVKSIAQDASVSDLRSMFAWVDSEADPEVKGSYKFPHHTGVGGPANVRACIAGIAALNGARGGASIPDADQKGVYSHLAQHLRDADREPPELRSSSADGLKFNDELSLVLCEVDNLIDRASEVVALRAKKGRSPLSVGSGELMEWLDTDLRRLKFLLTPTEDEAAIEYLRFLRSTLGEQTS